ncbi:Similar to S.cerevisiae protein YPT1 (Rab family GTPase) [Malassezia sympodialis ATCC 42132]|uniref:Similar to S.cerevisiae protein YPT1 (Rab family GTPase) n=1 Tax=Malassezia sympodialis (strain ATCC 42132) TaxID=1230383 RepID=A0A1M8A2Y3_MALS4|nr:Similar to S.cerevisiae protein YPT1 (Rab family GTPase) [Malassezia sympodialis ATCC 42132]
MAEPATTAELPTLKVLLIGSSGVGKSALVRRYTDDVFVEDDAAATIGVDFKIQSLCVDGKWCKLSIWDTAGQERYRTLTSSYYRGAQGVILVYDVTDARSFDDLPSWLQELNTFQGAVPPLRLLVGNKVDCTAERVVTSEQGADFAAAHGCLFVECSAKAGHGVDDAFAELVRQIVSTPALWDSVAPGVRRPGDRIPGGAPDARVELNAPKGAQSSCAC